MDKLNYMGWEIDQGADPVKVGEREREREREREMRMIVYLIIIITGYDRSH